MLDIGELTESLVIEKGSVNRSTRDSRVKNYEAEHQVWCSKPVIKDYDPKLKDRGLAYDRVYFFKASLCTNIHDLSVRERRVDYNGKKLTLATITPDFEKELTTIKAYSAL